MTVIGLDCETELIAPGRQAPPLVCLSVSDGTLVGWKDAEDLAVALLDSGQILGGHHVAFDWAVIAAQYPRLLPRIFAVYEQDRIQDTGVRQKLIDLANGELRGWHRQPGQKPIKYGYGLGDTLKGPKKTPVAIGLARRHFGIIMAKGEDTWRMRYGELRDVPVASWPDGAKKYAIDDAVIIPYLCNIQDRSPAEVLIDQYRQTRAAFWVQLMSCWGMITSPSAVAAFGRTAQESYTKLAATLVAAKLRRVDHIIKSGPRKGTLVEGSRDTKAAMSRLVAAYEAKGLPVPMTEGAKPRPSLEEDACFKAGDPLLHAYGEFGSASKTLSTDVPLVAAGAKEPIHGRFEILLETGDIGCSKPNLVNLPTRPGVRECFVPRPGFVFLACDYSGIQLRTWAQICIWMLGGSRMAQVLNAGEDPHTMVAADLLGITYEEAKGRPKSQDTLNTIYFERQCGKVCDFGLPGGMGPKRLVHAAANQYQIEITETKARTLKDTWRRTWPEAQPYLDLIGRMTADEGRIQITQFLSGRVRGGLGYCDTANGFFSSLAYDAIKSAGWLVAKACYVDQSNLLFGSRTVNCVHDELLLEVPELIGHECMLELERLMIEGASPWLPDVPPTVESVLMRHWSKKAKSVYENGRLVPWGPHT